MDENVAIRVDNVSKDFMLPHERTDSIKRAIVGIFRSKKRSIEIQHALKSVSFDIKKGEFVGIVGRNGSGKSTLLKIMAGIYPSTTGSVTTKGRLVPFIELGVGFNPELTGRENVYLNGALLGFSKIEMDKQYSDIVEFAELEEFMDQKLKNYSSGMQVRLAFSVATRASTDILILDEVLAVGDEAFQQKCFKYFATLKKEGKTVVLVTHDMDQVIRFCTRAILIDKKHQVEMGNPLEIAQIYRQLNNKDGTNISAGKINSKPNTKYLSVDMKHKKQHGKHRFSINLMPNSPIDDPVLAMGIYSGTGEEVYRWASDEKIPGGIDLQKHSSVEIELADVFPVDVFSVSLYLKKKDRSVDYAEFNDIVKFEVKNTSNYSKDIRWKIPEKVSVNGKEVTNVH